MVVLLSPFSVALNTAHYHISIFIGDTDFSAIWGPFHVFDVGSFTVVDHLLHPLALVFHEDYDGACGITGRQFSIFLVPGN